MMTATVEDAEQDGDGRMAVVGQRQQVSGEFQWSINELGRVLQFILMVRCNRVHGKQRWWPIGLSHSSNVVKQNYGVNNI